jgi:hypothetical protein
MAISKIAERQITAHWKMNPNQSGAAIYAKVHKWFTDKGRKDGPGLRTTQKRVKELNDFRTVEVPLDPILEPWTKDWPTDPESVETLLVLNDETNNVCRLFGFEGFTGLTDRISKWACLIQKSFDLNRLHDRLLLLELGIEFAMEERFGESTAGTMPLSFFDMPHQTLMAWNRFRFHRDRDRGIETGYVRMGLDESAWPNVELAGNIPIASLLQNIGNLLITQIVLKQTKQGSANQTEESVSYG